MTTQDRRTVEGVELGEMRPDEVDKAAGILALAYRDNALTFAFFGDDAERRYRVNKGIHEFRIGAMSPPPIVARRAGQLVGVCGFDPPGGSQPSAEAQQRFYRHLADEGALERAQQVIADFARHGPEGHHWHLGPVGVSPDAQGMGIGTLMVDAFCAQVDALGASAALETDREDNARLYAKSGFVTQEVAEVIGVPMWFMLREAKS